MNALKSLLKGKNGGVLLLVMALLNVILYFTIPGNPLFLEFSVGSDKVQSEQELQLFVTREKCDTLVQSSFGAEGTAAFRITRTTLIDRTEFLYPLSAGRLTSIRLKGGVFYTSIPVSETSVQENKGLLRYTISSFNSTYVYRLQLITAFFINVFALMLCLAMLRFQKILIQGIQAAHVLVARLMPGNLGYRRIFNGVLVNFFCAIVLIKFVVCLIAIFYFKSDFRVYDFLLTFSSELLVLLVLSALVLGLIRWNMEAVPFFSLLKFLMLTSLFLVMMGCVLFVYSSGYVYYTWGAYIEVHHIEAAIAAEVDDEVVYLLTQWSFILSVLSVLLLVGVLTYYSTKLTERFLFKKKVIVCALIISLGSLIQFFLPSLVSPFASSPILVLSESLVSSTDGIEEDLLTELDISTFELPLHHSVETAYSHLEGKAKGMNVLLIAMESVRKKNVSVYGYGRKTMPFLDSISNHAMVFHNACVNQPRSSKAMEALILGTYPDPRSQGMTRYPERIFTKDNILARYQNLDYVTYYGSSQRNYGGENFKNFLMEMSGGKMDKLIRQEDLIPAPTDDPVDEKLLGANFLNWSARQSSPFFALLWTESAHHPYKPNSKRFDGSSSMDRYDNCLNDVDQMIRLVLKGLEQQGKLDSTLVVIFGDHGEAVDEKMDFGHGSFLYEHSIRIPFILINKKLVQTKQEEYQTFQLKDVASTLLFLSGDTVSLHQSENIFAKSKSDKIYMSNVFQDFKIGLLQNNKKFVYRPKFNIAYYFDLTKDPEENSNRIHELSKAEVERYKQEVLRWYKFQLHYLDTRIRKAPDEENP